MNSKMVVKNYHFFTTAIEICRPTTSLLAASAPLAAIVATLGMKFGDFLLEILLSTLIVFFFTMGSNALNDLHDQKIDKINHPNRPLPSNRISVNTVFKLAIILFSITFLITLILVSVTNIFALGIVSLALLIHLIYEYWAKYNKGIGNFVIGSQSSLAFIFGGVVMENIYISGVMGLSAFLSVSGREIVKDIEDIRGDDDRITLPKFFGRRKAAHIAILLIGLSIISGIFPYFPLNLFGEIYLIFVAMASMILIISIIGILDNPRKSRKLMKIGMGIAIISFLIGGLLYG